jgi:hypothetical protein
MKNENELLKVIIFLLRTLTHQSQSKLFDIKIELSKTASAIVLKALLNKKRNSIKAASDWYTSASIHTQRIYGNFLVLIIVNAI